MLVVAFLYDPSAAGVLDSKADSYWLKKFFFHGLIRAVCPGQLPCIKFQVTGAIDSNFTGHLQTFPYFCTGESFLHVAGYVTSPCLFVDVILLVPTEKNSIYQWSQTGGSREGYHRG